MRAAKRSTPRLAMPWSICYGREPCRMQPASWPSQEVGISASLAWWTIQGLLASSIHEIGVDCRFQQKVRPLTWRPLSSGMSPMGTFLTLPSWCMMSAIEGRANEGGALFDFRKCEDAMGRATRAWHLRRCSTATKELPHVATTLSF